MSQIQSFGDGGSPSYLGIETVTGNSGGAVGGSGTPVNLNLLGDNVQGIDVQGTPGTSTQLVTSFDATAAAVVGSAQKGTSAYDNSDFDVVGGFVSLKNSPSGSVTTTADETKSLMTITLTPNSVTTIYARISGFASSIVPGTSNGIGGTLMAVFITGPVSGGIIGTVDREMRSFLSVTAEFTFSITDLDVSIDVTGDIDYDINWVGDAYKTEALE